MTCCPATIRNRQRSRRSSRTRAAPAQRTGTVSPWLLRDGGLEAGFELGAIQPAPDEHQAVHARDGAPWPLGLRVEHHVHAMEYLAAVFTLHVQHTLHAKDVLPAGLEQIVEPLVELRGVEWPRVADADGADVVFVVVRGELALGRRPLPNEVQAELERMMLAEQCVRAGLVDGQFEVRAWM